MSQTISRWFWALQRSKFWPRVGLKSLTWATLCAIPVLLVCHFILWIGISGELLDSTILALDTGVTLLVGILVGGSTWIILQFLVDLKKDFISLFKDRPTTWGTSSPYGPVYRWWKYVGSLPVQSRFGYLSTVFVALTLVNLVVGLAILAFTLGTVLVAPSIVAIFFSH